MLLITVVVLLISTGQLTAKTNNRPVIGIMSMPITDQGNQSSPSAIPSSYVKFIEMAGARVLPVLVGRDYDYYAEAIRVTNGILFTGGTLDLTKSIFTESAQIVWDLVINLNNQGDYYPLWGTCQGFELFAYLSVNRSWPLTSCSAWDVASSVKFLLSSDELSETKMFNSVDNRIIQILSSDKVTYNLHYWCLTESKFNKTGLNQIFKPISSNTDSFGLEYISIMEGISLPVFGVQFHPERTIYESANLSDYQHTPHSSDAVLVSQYFANFFVNEARKNNHVFPDSPEYQRQLIYNFCPKFTGLDKDASNEQTYFFD